MEEKRQDKKRFFYNRYYTALKSILEFLRE